MKRGYKFRGPFTGVMTAADVLRSAFWRHNYTWCYWMQAVVVKGEYNKDSVPQFDEEYIKGVDPEKMLSFKEIVIRTDAPIREKFDNNAVFWFKRGLNYSTKRRLNYNYSNFYDAFISYYYIMPRGGDAVDGFPGVDVFCDKMGPTMAAFGTTSNGVPEVMSTNTVRSLFPRHPNYVACFIPYTEKERSTTLIPELHLKTAKRYTVLQGYSESKKFYSPDYSGLRPEGKKDVRRTLHWASQPAVNGDGKIEIELFNSSIGKHIKVDANGVAGNRVFTTSTRMNDIPVAQNAPAADGSIFLRTDENGTASCEELPLGLYFIRQTNMAEGFAPCTPFLVTVPVKNDDGYVYAVNASPKTEVAKLTSITIQKVWNTDASTQAAEHVTVQLLRNGNVVKTATLNAQNNWQVTYTDMPESDAYSIKEVDVPKGFTATYQQKGYVLTVTNTSTLIQTGQLIWPIPVLAVSGMLLIAVGITLLKKKRKINA